mmetsp:Transcript_129873/g.238658  ORF Transcript_129873/g.238658 Transcript_129873/m.238658 type:complete len:469 (-) Transcript_129873:71-1477(-)
MHNACFTRFLLVCLCSGGSFSVSAISVFDSSGKDCLREAQQEADDASLLQVRLDTHEEHQLDEVHQLDHEGAAMPRKALPSQGRHGLGQNPDLHKKRISELMMEVQKSGSVRTLVRSFISKHFRSTNMNEGDGAMLILVVIFICAAILLGLFLFVCFDKAQKGSRQSSSQQMSSPILDPKSSYSRQSQGRASEGRASGGRASDGRPYQGSSAQPSASYLGPSTSAYGSGQAYGGGQAYGSGKAYGTSDSAYGGAPSTALSDVVGQSIGMPFCPSLVIPQGTRLSCMVRAVVRRQKQSLGFQVCSASRHGGSSHGQPLFGVEVQELRAGRPAIFLKSLDGEENLGFVCTEDLWSLPDGYDRIAIHPAMSIYRPSSALFGTVQKSGSGFVVKRGQTALMTIVGDFRSWNHNVKVSTSDGQLVATASQSEPEEYKVCVEPGFDAGLVLICLLSIDKLEGGADDMPGGTSTI